MLQIFHFFMNMFASLHLLHCQSSIPPENTNILYTVERIINFIVDDATNPRICEKIHVGYVIKQ